MAVMAAVYGGLAAYQLISGFAQADDIRAQAEAQRRIDLENIELAEFDGWVAEGYGQTQVARYQSTIDEARATAKVSAAASGVSMNDGSLAELQAQNDYVGLMNQMEIVSQAQQKALGYRREASGIRQRSGVMLQEAEAKANATTRAAWLNAGSTGLKAYGSYATGKIGTPSAPVAKKSGFTGYSNYAGSFGDDTVNTDDFNIGSIS